MNISEKVSQKIKKYKPGDVISFKDFEFLKSENAVALALSRLVKKGVINKLARGYYYKPKKTKWGVLKPNENDVLKSLIKNKNSKLYVSGLNAVNRLGLTTQVPSVIQIYGDSAWRSKNFGRIRVEFHPSKERLGFVDTEYLQILDALKMIKQIPDAEVNHSYKSLFQIINGLENKKIQRLTDLSFDKKPVVRALLGSMLETKFPDLAERLKSSLNNLTTYKLGLNSETVPNRDKWKIR